MKFLIIFTLLSLSLSATAKEKNWSISLAGGAGFASDPDVENNSADISIDSGAATQLVLNYWDKQNRDGAHLYYEFFYSRNDMTADVTPSAGPAYSNDIQADHLQIGGIYEWGNNDRFRPYFAATVGGSAYSSDFEDETYFSWTAGLGTKIWFTDSLALRLEARGLATVLDSSSAIFCANNACAVEIKGTLWWQQQLTAGLTYAF